MPISILRKFQTPRRSWQEYASGFLDFREDLEKKKKDLKEKFSQYYLQINDQEIKNHSFLISQFLKKGSADLIVPMKEQRGTVGNLLGYAKKKIPSEAMFIINDESAKEAVRTVKKFKGIRFIDKEEILKIINWQKLLPILNLSKIPRGKGTSVMAGYLLRYLLEIAKGRKSNWVFQTDADIKNHKKFKALEYLSYGILKYPNSFQVKIAKSGRNNEANMAIRSALAVLENLKTVIPTKEGKEISQRAEELFENLAKYKWILGGTFAISNEIAKTRPFATGYLDETLLCAFVEDKARKEGGFSVQVANPNPCSDGQNSFKKENIIIQMTANFIMTLLLAKKPVSDWSLSDIAWINKNLMSGSQAVVFIPPKGNEGPVIVEDVAQERILPSIAMMAENNLIDFQKAKNLLSSLK